MSYQYDGIVIGALAGVIQSQLTTYFSIADTDLNISRGYQPTKQYAGAVSGAKKYQVFINPITPGGAVGGGFEDNYTDGDDQVSRSYTAIKKVRYQVECLADFDINDDSSLEGMDLAQIVKDLLTQLDTIEELTAIGIFIVSCTDVRPAFSTSSNSNFESTPSFDVTLSYNSQYDKDLGRVVTVEEANIYRV